MSSIDLNDATVVSAYDELPLWSAMAGLLLLEHVPLRPDMVVLDIGCGTGFPALELAERLGRGAKERIKDRFLAIGRLREYVELVGSLVDGD